MNRSQAMIWAQIAVTAPGSASRSWNPARLGPEELIDRHGWKVKESNPSRHALANLLGVLADLGHDDILSRLDDYADLATRLAALDVGILDNHGSTDEILETAVVVTLLGDVLISLLRRLAQEDRSRNL